MNRPTIRDIAREAGVSTTAVSFALNNRPGISEATRTRILETANRIGWAPNLRAQSLSLAKADAIGLFIARQAESFSSERFFFNFIAGLEQTLSEHGYDLVFHTGVDTDREIATYRLWRAQGRVDGVVLVDPQEGDPRIAVLRELEMPVVVVGSEAPGLPSVVGDEKAMIDQLAAHLVERGARRIGYVSLVPSLLHVRGRIDALEEFAREHGIEQVTVSCKDATEAAGGEAIGALLERESLPDAVIFDNEMLALGGMSALRAAGKTVGQDVLIASCEDSPLCRLVTPTITVASREPAGLGATAGKLLIDVIAGEPARVVADAPAEIIVRESTKGRIP